MAVKPASLGVPVVLLFLGFLKAQDTAGQGPLFRSEAEWTGILKDHSRGTVDETRREAWIEIKGVPLTPLVQGIGQPFDPGTAEAGM